MPPRKQPLSLYETSIKTTISLINEACSNIDRNYREYEYPEREEEVRNLKCYLLSLLPARIFDVLCAHRSCSPLRSDPSVQLYLLTHPNINIFYKCDLDNSIPHYFWLKHLQCLTKLVVLDLKLICTDEILQVVGQNCLLLEEINTVSRVNLRKSPFNASVLTRNVSDAGLEYLLNLIYLKILAIDSPRNERASIRVGRCISQAGIRKIVSSLPALEELRVESCDIGTTLISSDISPGPLSLKKINCHFASAESVKKLVSLCPNLKEFSLTHLSEHNKDEILQQLACSNLELSRIDLSFFSFTYSLQELLKVKGVYLTQFSLWEIENSITLEAIIAIGRNCPNLTILTLMTQSKCLMVPSNFWCFPKIFFKLKSLTLGCDNFDIEKLLIFFTSHTQCLHQLTLKYQTMISLDYTLMTLVNNGFLKYLTILWLDCTLIVSKGMIRHLIDSCNYLKSFTVNLSEDRMDICSYIKENNFDLKLDSNY